MKVGDAMADDTMITTPMAANESRPKPHAVVIGSGFGGLAAAVRLGARGYRVTMLERLDAPGGRAYVFRQDGFTFDAGPTIVTAPFLFEELWALCGKRLADDVELRAIEPFYRIRFDDGEVFDYSGDPEKMRREVTRLSPDDLDRLRAVHEAQRRDLRDRLRGARPRAVRLDRSDMLRVAPDLVRLGAHRSVLQHRREPHPRRAAAHGVQLPSAADRRQSVHGQLDLLSHQRAGTELGRAFRDGRDGTAGRRGSSG